MFFLWSTQFYAIRIFKKDSLFRTLDALVYVYNFEHLLVGIFLVMNACVAFEN